MNFANNIYKLFNEIHLLCRVLVYSENFNKFTFANNLSYNIS